MATETLTDLTWDDVEQWAQAQQPAWDAGNVIELACRQRRATDERWEAAKMVIAGDLSYFYEHTEYEWMELRRLSVHLLYVLDLVQGEADGPVVDIKKEPLGSRTGAPYATVRKLEEAYIELGRAIETWKQSL